MILYYRLFHGILSGKKAADSVDSPNKVTSLAFDQTSYRAEIIFSSSD